MIYSIGHSAHTLERFRQMLTDTAVDVVVDVRSRPYSRWAPHFNQTPLKERLAACGFKYMYFGGELGGMPDDARFYDEHGHVLYGKMAAEPAFQHALDRLATGAGKYRIALMCGEEDPSGCHRRLLVARALSARGIDVLHMRADGRLMGEGDFPPARKAGAQTGQLLLFGDADDREEWKSPHSIPARARQD